MTPSFEKLQKQLKQLPGVGYRSAERIALHLLVEKPEQLPALVQALGDAARTVKRCARCGNLAEDTGDASHESGAPPSPAPRCAICADERRDHSVVCAVEHVPDLVAMERTAAYRGVYHVLHGKLSPISGIGPEQLNFATLFARVKSGEARELILALSNDVEGEATCHYLTQRLPKNENGEPIKTTRIGFGLPSGAGVLYADSVTLKSALEGRRAYQ